MEKRFDLITIGDSTIDTFIKIHEATVKCDLNRQQCKICVPYGAKIPVDSTGYGVAGNAANVAVGCAKLGLKTAIYTNLGDDNQGKTIQEALAKEGIVQDYIQVNRGKKSNLSVVLTFQGERTIFVYHQDWQYHLPDLAPAGWLYLTSMAETFSKSNIMNEIYYYLSQTTAKLVFNPGTYQLKTGIKRYPKILEKCEVLVVNLEEAKKILEIDQLAAVDVRDILSKLLFLGTKIVVVTNGDEGSYATDGAWYLKAGVRQTKIVEKTGAGDAYTSGLIAALAHGLPLAEAVIWGTINASFVIEELGPQNGLLTYDQIKKQRQLLAELVATNF